MKKEKYIISRKLIGGLLLKTIIVFGVFILAAAATMFMQSDKTLAAKKKTNSYIKILGGSMQLKNGVLTIQKKGDPFVAVNETVLPKKSIRKVIVKEGVTWLPDEAFKDCKNLKTVILPNSLKTIGISAFNNTAVKSIKLPKNLKVIKKWAFEGCNIEKINIPKSVERIGVQAFCYTKIKNITIPKSVKKLGVGVLDGCKKLETVTMPGDVEVIKVPKPSIDNDFFSCTDLFYYKRRDDGSSDPIKKVKFTTALNTDILKRLAECESYEVSSKDPHFKSVDGMIYSKDGKTLVRIPLGRKKVVISDKCSTVATRSYGYRTYGMSVLREIVFPKSVVKITSDNDLNFDISHYKCKNIKVSLNMSQLDNKSIQRLWTTNKYWKKSLKNELLRKGFASLNEKNERMLMLADGYLCSYLKKEETDTDETETREDIVGLVIPDNVKTIGKEAFSEYDISYITLENGVEFIEDYAFEGCGLKDENDNWYAVVYVKRDNIHISDKAFAGGESVRIVMEK